jgi:hypothetical protein
MNQKIAQIKKADSLKSIFRKKNKVNSLTGNWKWISKANWVIEMTV